MWYPYCKFFYQSVLFWLFQEPQPKQLMLMYARIHLLRAVAQVMRDGLALLNIEPISQLWNSNIKYETEHLSLYCLNSSVYKVCSAPIVTYLLYFSRRRQFWR